jgi:hypothetical protein
MHFPQRCPQQAALKRWRQLAARYFQGSLDVEELPLLAQRNRKSAQYKFFIHLEEFKSSLIRTLFDYSHSLSEKKYLHTKWISVFDFTELLKQSEIVPNLISEKEAYLIFVQSI